MSVKRKKYIRNSKLIRKIQLNKRLFKFKVAKQPKEGILIKKAA
jgi:hypothetical protein